MTSSRAFSLWPCERRDFSAPELRLSGETCSGLTVIRQRHAMKTPHKPHDVRHQLNVNAPSGSWSRGGRARNLNVSVVLRSSREFKLTSATPLRELTISLFYKTKAFWRRIQTANKQAVAKILIRRSRFIALILWLKLIEYNFDNIKQCCVIICVTMNIN
jgi:hypothetical protein